MATEKISMPRGPRTSAPDSLGTSPAFSFGAKISLLARDAQKNEQKKAADQHGGMLGRAGYVNQLSRWYNPWTKQQVTDPAEKTLMRVGQGALGLGAAAGAGAAGVAAAAPGLAATPLTHLPAYFTGHAAAQAGAGAAGLGAASQRPGVQQMFPTVTNAVNSVANRAGQVYGAASNALQNAGLRLHQAQRNVAERIPHPVHNAWHAYEHYIGEPLEHAAKPFLAGPIDAKGNMIPHKFLPFEAAGHYGHHAAHKLETFGEH